MQENQSVSSQESDKQFVVSSKGEVRTEEKKQADQDVLIPTATEQLHAERSERIRNDIDNPLYDQFRKIIDSYASAEELNDLFNLLIQHETATEKNINIVRIVHGRESQQRLSPESVQFLYRRLADRLQNELKITKRITDAHLEQNQALGKKGFFERFKEKLSGFQQTEVNDLESQNQTTRQSYESLLAQVRSRIK